MRALKATNFVEHEAAWVIAVRHDSNNVLGQFKMNNALLLQLTKNFDQTPKNLDGEFFSEPGFDLARGYELR